MVARAAGSDANNFVTEPRTGTELHQGMDEGVPGARRCEELEALRHRNGFSFCGIPRERDCLNPTPTPAEIPRLKLQQLQRQG